MVAKYVPGDPFNYMGDLHSSLHQRLMIAEINQAYQPALVLLDGVEAFVNGGPESGQKVASLAVTTHGREFRIIYSKSEVKPSAVERSWAERSGIYYSVELGGTQRSRAPRSNRPKFFRLS